MTRARLNPVSTSLNVWPKCSCAALDPCSDCANEMASELESILAVVNVVQYGKSPWQLPLAEGGVAELLAAALWGPRDMPPAPLEG